MAIKAVIFDADGMLIKRKEYFSARLAREYDIPEEKIMPFFKGEFQDCTVGKADLKTSVTPYLKEWNWQGTADDLLDYWFSSERELDEQVTGEIGKLRSREIRCFLATNNEKYRMEYLRKNLKLDDIFDGIYASSEIGCKKPDKKFFQHISHDLEKFGITQPEEIMFWDNDERNITSAKEIGWQGHVYEGFDKFKEIILKI